jgi:hypothetical protein
LQFFKKNIALFADLLLFRGKRKKGKQKNLLGQKKHCEKIISKDIINKRRQMCRLKYSGILGRFGSLSRPV